MAIHLQRDLNSIRKELLSLAIDVEEAIHNAIRSLQDRDARLAQRVIEGDSTIDQYENHLEEECLKVLALHQPVAIDLRRVASAIKINMELERMADLAEEIAERAIRLTELPQVPIPMRLQAMTDVVVTMVRQSLAAFFALEVKAARRVIGLDDDVDRFNNEIIGELIVMMRATGEMVEPALSLFSAVRHLERIADHATNIAEDVVYLVEGEIIRHRRDKVEVH
jgi:phosphate transport system protein